MRNIGYWGAKLLYKLRKNDKEVISRYFRNSGMKIGGGCNICCNIMTSEPYLISIGDNVTIAGNVTFVTHDNSISKIDTRYANLFGYVEIGNNCFIGQNVTVMYGVTLANNIIVASGSVVCNSFSEENIIIGGNPAKKIGNWNSLEAKGKCYAMKKREAFEAAENKEYRKFVKKEKNIMEELVSIVVPVYNMGNSIEVCVNSLLKQNYDNIEILLVDDGSKDNSLEKCNKLKDKDNRIRVYHTENRGSGPARNTGIENAKGRYIYFPDADDQLEENAISILVAGMQKGKYDLVVFGYKSLDKNGNTVLLKQYPEMEKKGEDVRQNYSDYVASTRKYGIQGAPWNKFFDLSLIKMHSIEYPPLRRHQDEGFISRYMCFCNNIHFIQPILYIHNLNDLKKEWDKYPVDYIDAVIGLYNTKKETILTWNKKDKKTKMIIEHEYICNVIKSLEMSYSPKMHMKSIDRIPWIRKQIEKAQVLDIDIPNTLGRYQRTVLMLIRKNHIKMALIIMRFKIEVEKKGALKLFRR